jgi:rare lipoprotein A
MMGLMGRPFPVIFLVLSACSLSPSMRPPADLPPARGPSQTGIASWYGPGFHGQRTASGAVYDQNQLTAAHQTLPLGTRVMVTNLQNGSSAEVTVNDRGPFAKGRIVDLSYSAAQILGMIGPGTAPVRLEVIQDGSGRTGRIPDHLIYTLQAGSFADIRNAQRLKAKLLQMDTGVSPVEIVSLQGKEGTYYRVQVGSFSERGDAEKHARLLAGRGLSIIIMEK